MDLINVAAVSALVILAARPSEITDASFLLSFSAVATIGAIAIPCIARSSEPYRLALDHLSDVTRDVSHAPRVIQFRLEMRAAAHWISARLPRFAAPFGSGLLVRPFRAALLFLGDHFHFRHSSARDASSAGLLFSSRHAGRTIRERSCAFADGIGCPDRVPHACRFPRVSPACGMACETFWDSSSSMLDAAVRWFAGWHGASYRIPGPSDCSHGRLCRIRDRVIRGHSDAIGSSGGCRAPRLRWWPRQSSSRRIPFRRASRLSVWN